MRECPFCGFDEGWVKNQGKYFYVECKVCESTGPKSLSSSGAEEKWNGILSSLDGKELNLKLEEEAIGGVSSPISTLNNTQGIGNAQPAKMAAMTGAQQYDSKAIGSGDKWDAGKKTKPKKKNKKHKIDSFEEYSQKIKSNGLTKK